MRNSTVRALLALPALALYASSCLAQGGAGWDFQPRPLTRIPSGVVVGGDTVQGWSNPILFVRGQLTSGDLSVVNSTVTRYAELFNLILLANVVQQGDDGYVLEKAAIGFSTSIGGRNVVITSDTHRQLGANLGFIGGSVFSGNEAALKDTQQTARYRYGMVIDAPTLLLRDGKHVLTTARYFIWVSRRTGDLGVLVWAMDDPGPGADFRLIDATPQLLPPNLHENRRMHVDGGQFNMLGIPSATAFAVESLPPGTDVPFSPELAKAACVRTFDQQKYVALLTQVAKAVAQTAPAP
ncbi:hypothetical protein Pla175_42690 [Pirellulimonas nuda]|uniref:Uncharacterized protein n=1 Tax=Pirellulimonas nuda TaxID=2528009 RepID=A0A518DHB0_9BACT|nr:pyruvate kinase [Pirellulimonas nuda]QDU90856.1 hypothetical protein Pla175_42690 [Pirellulimonas nuda]